MSERLLAALTVIPKIKPPVRSKKTVDGLRWVATDVDWSYGGGAEVQGPGEALVLAAAGRTVVLDELSRDGVDPLRTRLS